MPLFGSIPFGSGLYGSPDGASSSASGDLVVFDDFSLSDGTVVLCTDLIDSGPSRDLLGGAVPRADGEYVTADYFRTKVIEVRGIIKGTDAADLDANLDIVRAALRRRQGNLDITRHGTTRRYVATMMSYGEVYSDRKGYHITFCPFVARFECKIPFGQDVDYSVTEAVIGTSPFNQDIQNLGTIEALPVIYLVFDAATAVTAVNLKNLTTGEEVEFVGSVVAGDILKIDSEATEVSLNGVAQTFAGSLPSLDVGGNLLQLSVTGTSFSATATFKHKPRFL